MHVVTERTSETTPARHHQPDPRGRQLRLLALAALGVVFGDIGTSPLYALREAFVPAHGVAPTPTNVLGVLSLIFWALIIVISIKYLMVILRADNRGEGGILALTALVTPVGAPPKTQYRRLILLGLFGAALVYGDGMITPAISVLSAVEGLRVATPLFESYILPVTVAILIGLFSFQHRGTGGVGRIFGPVMMVWFAVLALLGIPQIVRHPTVLAAVNPLHGAQFFLHNGWFGFLVLGSVFLVVTGGEALYADMGHFGRRPIRLAWFALVLPALLLNYFGQGALLLSNPAAIIHPFYGLAPAWALLPLVLLSTAATVIASQALISGAFSLTMQAVQLGYMPRMEIAHTSESQYGQIYIPSINWGLMVACIGLVLGFGSSTNLAAAYGFSVTTSMVIELIIFYAMARGRWHWARPAALALVGSFLAVDLSFWASNSLKIPHGGWFPIVIGILVFTLMTTWKKGRIILAKRIGARTPAEDTFLQELRLHPPIRVPGTAVFMYSNPAKTPPALLHNLRHNSVLHERVVLLSVLTEEIPYVDEVDRTQVRALGKGIFRVIQHYGFMETAKVPESLAKMKYGGLRIDPEQVTYFLGQETILASEQPGMAIWREKLFGVMTRNARSAASFFCLPPDQVVELGTQVEI